MITIKDVAKAAGVSPATASRALAGYGYVKESTRQRVQSAAEQLGYRPNAVARSMVKGSTQTIGLVISDISNPFFPEVVRGIEDETNRRGSNIVLCNSDEDSEKERHYIDVLVSKQVDGLIITSTSENASHLSDLSRHVPIVLLDRSIPKAQFDAVVVNNAEGALDAVSHLINLGHTRIGLVSGPKRVTTMAERVAGYKKALQQHNLPVNPQLMFHGDLKESGGYQGLRHLMQLPEPPTAILSTNNRTTTGVLMAARELGLVIPRDFSIIGFDDMPWMSLLQPPLSVVKQPTYELGVRAAELLFERMGNPDSANRVVQLE